MKVLVALVCTLGAVACGEQRQADDPSTHTTTSTTVTTTETSTAPAAGTQRPPATTAPVTTPPVATSPPTDGREMTQPPHTDGAAYGSLAPEEGTTLEHDRKGAVTPLDQGGGKDRDITAAIRRSVVGDKALSFTAKNVKIITVGGKVTLRGPVKSDDEKAAIETKAKSTAGVGEVDNQLEVKK